MWVMRLHQLRTSGVGWRMRKQAARTSGHQARLPQLDGHTKPPQLDRSRVLLGGQQDAVGLQGGGEEEEVEEEDLDFFTITLYLQQQTENYAPFTNKNYENRPNKLIN